MRHTIWRVLAAATALALVVQTGSAAAQGSTVTGRVTSADAGTPIVGAQVMLVGGNRQTTTDREGRYTLVEVTPGRVVVRVVAIGHEAQQAVLTLASAEAVTQDFVLNPVQLSLDELVVTATGQQRKRQLGTAISSIDASAAVEDGVPTSFGNLLQGRVASVQIQNASGTTGTGTRVRIRGSGSISLLNEPLLYVDGVRYDNNNDVLSFGIGGQTISALNDINTDDIESIEIIKGPAAATLYGTEAANGVIRIKTKRGEAGAPRWNAYVEQGATVLTADFPDNYQAFGAGGSANLDFCWTYLQAFGYCDITEVMSFNPLQDSRTTPFKTGHRQQYGVNVSGGTSEIQYFISGEWESEDGIFRMPEQEQAILENDPGSPFGEGLGSEFIRPNHLERFSLRGNVRAQVAPNADVNLSVGVISSDLRLPQNDNNVTGILGMGYFGSGLGGDGLGFDGQENTLHCGLGSLPPFGTCFGAWALYPPGEVFLATTNQGTERVTTGLTGNWQPFAWLTTRATVGFDFTSRINTFFQAPNTGVDFANQRLGSRQRDDQSTWQYTLDAGATGQFQLTERLSSTTSVGLQYFRNNFTIVQTYGELFPPGTSSQNNAVDQQIGEGTTESITLGTFVEQQFGFNDRVFVTGALRADDNSAFGREFNVEIYPKVSVSWLMSEEPWFPESGFLNNLRLRGAWGASGLQPGVNAAIQFLEGISVRLRDSDELGVTVSNAGNPGLEPERSYEVEVGLDASLLNGRVGVEATYFDKRTTNALVQRTMAPSLGIAPGRWENIGEVSNRGIEGVLNALVVNRNGLSWDLTLSASTFRNRLEQLGEGVDPILLGFNQRHDKGYALGGYWDYAFLGYSDANNDGIIGPDEVQMGDEIIFRGEAMPKHEASMSSAFTLFNRVRISGLFDYRGGHKLYNMTDEWKCIAVLLNCRGLNDPDAPLSEQARAAGTLHPSQSTDAYIEPGWFVKLRELSATVFMPDTWAEALRVDRMSLTVAGRNLFTITDYTGIDPDLNMFGGANFSEADFLTQPQTTYWTARLNVAF